MALAAEFWEGTASGGFKVTIETKESSVSLNDVVTINLTLNYPTDYHPNLNMIKANLLVNEGFETPPFKLLNETISPPKSKGETLEQKMTYVLDPQIPGTHFLTFYNITFQPNEAAKNKPVDIISNVMTIQVHKAPSLTSLDEVPAPLMRLNLNPPVTLSEQNRLQYLDNSDRKEQERLRNVAIIQSKMIPWDKLSGVMAFILLIIVMQYVKKQKPLALFFKKDPQQIALKALDHLKTQDLPSQDRYDEFYSCLTEIVRHFIEDRYRIKATTQTTQEFLNNSLAAFDSPSQELLSNFLQSSDRVKFSRYAPTFEECQTAEETAQQFISGSESPQDNLRASL
jgi:hypothetical protein